MERVDPILLELLRNELSATTEEMAIAIHKTARSSMLRMGDFATALADGQGRMVGLGRFHMLALTVFSYLMPFVLKKFAGQFKPGDVILCNDPYSGGSHMPDVILVAPVFYREQLAGFTVVYSHQNDVGGRFQGGSSSQCTESYEEGIRFPNLKLYDGGVRNEPLVQLLSANIRASDEWFHDIEAKISGCWRGNKEFQAVLDKYGLERVNACFDYLIENSEQAARRAIASVKPGDYSRTEILRDDGYGNEVALPVTVTLRFRGDKLTVDFTGTAPQLRSAINMPYSNTLANVWGPIHSVLAPEAMFNSGFVKPIEVIAPLGTLANPEFPAAVAGRVPVFYLIIDALYQALAQVIPDRVGATTEGADLIHFAGKAPNGDQYATYDLVFGGWGGRPRKDGIDGLAGSYSTMPAELLEREIPVVVEGLGLESDTAGPGKYRGSLAVFKTYRFLCPTQLMVRTNRPFQSCAGMAGGGSAAPSLNIFTPADGEPRELQRKSHAHIDVKPGDRLYHRVCGAAGHGDPYTRDLEKVLDDVREEKVSLEAARAVYGVVIDPAAMAVNQAETAALRRQLMAGKPPAGC